MARVKIREVVLGSDGRPGNGATVLVCEPGTSSPTAPGTPIAATLRSARTGGTTLTNPLTANAAGEVVAWIDTYQLVDLYETYLGATRNVPFFNPESDLADYAKTIAPTLSSPTINTPTISGGTASGVTSTDAEFADELTLVNQSGAPSGPAGGRSLVYPRTDGRLYHWPNGGSALALGYSYDKGANVHNVRAYGAVGNGATNDATAIDAAVAACQAAGGGTVYFPPGRYVYSGTGIVNAPGLNVNQPLLLRGAGESATQLVFTAVSNPEAIKLSATTAIGNFVCQGSGVEHLYIEVPTTKDAISISNVEQWRVRHVSTAQCKTFLKIFNTRFGRAEHLYIYNFREHGITVNEGLTTSGGSQNFDSSQFSDIEITGSVTPTGWGFSMLMGANPDGNEGTYLFRVLVNNGVGGIRIGSTSGVSSTPLIVFLENCVADSGAFTEPCFRITNGAFVYLEDCWAYGLLAGKAAVEFDRVSYCSWLGGQAANGHGTVGGLGSIFDLKNGCSSTAIEPSHMIAAPGGTGVTGLNCSTGTAPSAITFASGYQENLAQMIAAGKLLSASDTQRAMSATHMYTSNASPFAEFALLDQGLAHGKYFRINPSTGELEVLNTAHNAVIATVSNTGDIARRRRISTSMALAATDIVASSGFGSTRAVSAVSGGDDHFRFDVTAGGSGIASSPTIVVTFKDGAYAAAPQATVTKFGSYQPSTPVAWTTTTTTLTITFAGTPVAGEVYEFSVMTTGR